MVAFLLELQLGRILGEGRKDFHRFGGEWARSLFASHMVDVKVDWSACTEKKFRTCQRAYSQQLVQTLHLDETKARCAHLTDSAKYTRVAAREIVGILLTWLHTDE